MPRTTLVTGAAGFIGYHTARHLLERGNQVVGLDNLNDYYEVSLKQDRLRQLDPYVGFHFERADLVDRQLVAQLFQTYDVDDVVHLAAQVGVRSSVEAPHPYIENTVVGFLNVLDCCRHHRIKHLVYASSSSVYGGNTRVPYSVQDSADHPISLYAASKRSNELMAHAYSHLFGLPTTGLRFFTVYGPWGRPDMALSLFAQAITKGEPINVFNGGEMSRDYTYVDDIVQGVLGTLDRPAAPDPQWNSAAPLPATSAGPYRLYNIGNSTPVSLVDVIEELERCLGQRAKKEFLPMQLGDMLVTHADVKDLAQEVGYCPRTGLRDGIRAFVDWYCDYYGVEH